MEHAFHSIQDNAELGGFYDEECILRFRRLKKFPYVVLYRERGEYVEIIALSHTSREPGYWRDLLD